MSDFQLQQTTIVRAGRLERWGGWARSNPYTLYLAGILMASVLFRVAAAFYLGPAIENLPGTADQLSYHTLALRVLGGHGFTFGQPWWPATAAGAPTAHWSYLYTFYLVAVYAVFGPSPIIARLIQAVVVGCLQPYLIYRIGRHLFGEIAGLVGAALVAGYAYFIYYAAALMTESFYITAILGALYLAMRFVQPAPRTAWQTAALSIGLGLSLGAAILLRQPILLFTPLLFLWIGWANRGPGRRWSTLACWLIAGSLIAGLILPFTIYNYLRFKQFVLLNTNVGFAFFWSNHPIYGTTFQPILSPEIGNYGALIPAGLSHLNEAQLDQELLKRGLQFVADDPGRYVLLSLSRIPAYFMFWPSPESSLISNISRVASFGLLWPFMLYGLICVFRRPAAVEGRWRSPTFLLLGFALFYTLLHLLSWALIRYRLPVDAVLLTFAGAGLVDLATRLKQRAKRFQPV